MNSAYGGKSFASVAERAAFLFELYQKYTSLLPSQSKAGKSRKKQKVMDSGFAPAVKLR